MRDPRATPAQEALWWAHQRAARKSVYHITWRLGCASPPDPAALRAAWRAVVDRHDALRMGLAADDGVVRAAVADRLSAPVRTVSVDTSGPAAPLLARIAEEVHDEPMPLDRPPLARLVLVRVDDEHELLLTAHHSVVDGWAIRLVLDDLSTAYQAALSGGQPTFPEAPSFAQYALDQRAAEEKGRWRKAIEHWRTALDGASAVTVAPDRPVRARPGGAGTTLRHEVSPEAARGLAAHAQAAGTTSFAVMLAALQTVLARGGAGGDVTVATPAANRLTAREQKLVGYLTNLVVARAHINDTDTVADVTTAPATPCGRCCPTRPPPTRRSSPNSGPHQGRSGRHPAGGPDPPGPPVLGPEPRPHPPDPAPQPQPRGPSRLHHRLLGHRRRDRHRGRVQRGPLRPGHHPAPPARPRHGPGRGANRPDQLPPPAHQNRRSPHARRTRNCRSPVGQWNRGRRPRPTATPPQDRPLPPAITHAWRQVLGHPPTSPDQDFFAAGGTSLTVLHLAAAVEAATGERPDLIAWLADPTPRRLAGQGRTDTPTTLVVLRDTTGPHLHLVHGAGGSPQDFRDLVDALPGWRVTASQDRTTHTTVTALAATYAADLSGQAPDVIAGWSFGGLVAHEMAHDAALLLIDTPPPTGHPDHPTTADFAAMVTDLKAPDSDDDTLAVRALAAHLAVTGDDVPAWALVDRWHAYRRHARAGAAHVSEKRTRTAATVIAADLTDDDVTRWRAHLPDDTRVVRVAADHWTVLRAPAVARVADAVRSLRETR
nr:hypothetical protein GCM10017745_36270 [Saccharothrix mutabilis subsp. capreolus]